MCCPTNKVIKSLATKSFLALLSEGYTTTSYATFHRQRHRPISYVETGHQTSLFHIESNPNRLGLLSPKPGFRRERVFPASRWLSPTIFFYFFSVAVHILVCVCVCFLPIHSGLQWTYQPGCGACLNFSREKDSAVPFPRRP